MKMRFGLGVLAYLVPTFALGFVWRLMLFKDYYEHLAVYRKDIIIPFGFLSMLIQSFVFAWVYQHAFAQRNGSPLSRGFRYAAIGAVLSWSFTTLAAAAKNLMTSVPDYLIIETAFTAVQWIIVGPLTGFAFSMKRTTLHIAALVLLLSTVPVAVSQTGAAPTPKRTVAAVSANAELLKLLRAGMPESVVLAKINDTTAKFDTSTDALIALKAPELRKRN